jgi:hypothetical protein
VPRTISDTEVEQVMTATLEQAPPDGGTHWSTRLMATHAGLTQTAVSRIWRGVRAQAGLRVMPAV